MSQTRPRVAVVATTYFSGSHADVVATRLMDGYEWNGAHVQARVDVVSLYLEQLGGTIDRSLLLRALSTFELTTVELRQALDSVHEVFLVQYVDGLTEVAVNCGEVIRNFGVACQGATREMACQIWLQPEPHGAFHLPGAPDRVSDAVRD